MEKMSQVGCTLDKIRTPAFLVDRVKVEANCLKVRKLCETNNLQLRAQTKTHKTIEIVDLQTNGSRRGLVCSTLEECYFYANHCCDDIVFGFPVQESQFGAVYDLTSKLEKFHVFTDSIDITKRLCNTEAPPGKKWSVLIKVDCGGNRAGVWWQDTDTGLQLANVLKGHPKADLQGVYVHCGNTYTEESVAKVKSARDETIDRLDHFVSSLREAGHTVETVGIGSTPSCSHTGNTFQKLTELHPGNYIFYDLMQEDLGSCTRGDIAGCVATRVIGHYPRRKQLLVDCGFTAFTKQGPKNKDYKFGVFQNEPNLRLVEMTQEIGFVQEKTGELNFDKYPVGSMLFLLPYHACATSNQFSNFLVIESGKVIDEWQTVARR